MSVDRWIVAKPDQDGTRLRVLAIEADGDEAHRIAERERALVLIAVGYDEDEPTSDEGGG